LAKILSVLGDKSGASHVFDTVIDVTQRNADCSSAADYPPRAAPPTIDVFDERAEQPERLGTVAVWALV
jgi:hypothetical protein